MALLILTPSVSVAGRVGPSLFSAGKGCVLMSALRPPSVPIQRPQTGLIKYRELPPKTYGQFVNPLIKTVLRPPCSAPLWTRPVGRSFHGRALLFFVYQLPNFLPNALSSDIPLGVCPPIMILKNPWIPSFPPPSTAGCTRPLYVLSCSVPRLFAHSSGVARSLLCSESCFILVHWESALWAEGASALRWVFVFRCLLLQVPEKSSVMFFFFGFWILP